MHLLKNKTSLTPKEVEVLQLFAEGESQQSIAEKMYVSQDTVKFRSKRLRQKLGASTIAQAIYMAMRKSLIQ